MSNDAKELARLVQDFIDANYPFHQRTLILELAWERYERRWTVEPEIYDPPRTCWNCGRKVDGYWVGIEPVTFCSKDCEVHYQRKVQRAREMEEARRDR